MHLDLNARITVYCSERYTMYSTVQQATQCRTTDTTKCKAPAVRSSVLSQIVRASDPPEFTTRSDFGVGR